MWNGFGLTATRGVVLKRESGRWVMDAVRGGRGGRERPTVRRRVGTVPDAWVARLMALRPLDLPDGESLPNRVMVLDGFSDVIESRWDGRYRDVVFLNPGAGGHPGRPHRAAPLRARPARLLEDGAMILAALLLDPPPAWEKSIRPVFAPVARAAGLRDLRQPHRETHREIRLWRGFGLTPTEGVILRRDAGRWTLTAVRGGWGRPVRAQAVGMVSDAFVARLMALRPLGLPDGATLPNRVIVDDGSSDVIESRWDGRYRAVFYDNPASHSEPQDRRVVAMEKLLFHAAAPAFRRLDARRSGPTTDRPDERERTLREMEEGLAFARRIGYRMPRAWEFDREEANQADAPSPPKGVISAHGFHGARGRGSPGAGGRCSASRGGSAQIRDR